jgi:hypothetical protein
MSLIRQAVVLAGASFVAATLQGSRLPEEANPETTPVAQLEAPFGYRPGPGSERDENPPIWDGGHYA